MHIHTRAHTHTHTQLLYAHTYTHSHTHTHTRIYPHTRIDNILVCVPASIFTAIDSSNVTFLTGIAISPQPSPQRRQSAPEVRHMPAPMLSTSSSRGNVHRRPASAVMQKKLWPFLPVSAGVTTNVSSAGIGVAAKVDRAALPSGKPRGVLFKLLDILKAKVWPVYFFTLLPVGLRNKHIF